MRIVRHLIYCIANRWTTSRAAAAATEAWLGGKTTVRTVSGVLRTLSFSSSRAKTRASSQPRRSVRWPELSGDPFYANNNKQMRARALVFWMLNSNSNFKFKFKLYMKTALRLVFSPGYPLLSGSPSMWVRTCLILKIDIDTPYDIPLGLVIYRS